MQSQQPGWRIPFVHLVCQPVQVFPMMHDFDPPMQQCSWIGQRQNKTTMSQSYWGHAKPHDDMGQALQQS